jgi:hypothetical protein
LFPLLKNYEKNLLDFETQKGTKKTRENKTKQRSINILEKEAGKMETNVSILQASNRRNLFISMPSSADGLHLAQVDPRFACFESQSAVRRKNRPEMAIKKSILEKRSRKLETNHQHFAGSRGNTDSPQCHHLQTPAS